MENKQFFDPYNFNNISHSVNQNLPEHIDGNNFMQITQPSPTMFYEQQYWYYNYLTKMLEYKIKLKEYENINKNKNQM